MNRHDRKLWASARTLTDLGDLTARWLEGDIKSVPGYCGGPAEETTELIPVLAACDRAGFVTDSSQPGGGYGWSQRAAVCGFVTPETWVRLWTATEGLPLIRSAVRSTRWRIRYKTAFPVTRCGGTVFTRFGATLSRRRPTRRPGIMQETVAGYGKSAYPNTITLRAGRFLMFKPPSGRQARAWDTLRAEYPEIDGARITQSGAYLNVQVERTMGAAPERLALVGRLAEVFGAEVQEYPSSWDAGTGTVTWVLFTYQGVQVCVETAVCSCHPDVVASSPARPHEKQRT